MKLKSPLWITIVGLFIFVSISHCESQSSGASWGTEKKTYIDIDTAQNDFVEAGSGKEGAHTDATTDDEDMLDLSGDDDIDTDSSSGSGHTEVTKSTTKAPTTKKMTACEQLRLSTKDFSADFYIPVCTTTGEFERRQCEGKPSLKKCWCVDPTGSEIPGTQMSYPQQPDCHEGTNLKTCVFELLKHSYKGLLLGAFKPRCTIEGEFEMIQCFERDCWCVDNKGIEKLGTRQTSSSPPVCEELTPKPGTPINIIPNEPTTKAQQPDTTKKPHVHTVTTDKEDDKDDDDDDDDEGYEFVTPDKVDVSIGGGKFEPENKDNNENDKSVNSKQEAHSTFLQMMESPGILAAVIGGSVVGLLCAILLVMFIVYRMRKKDEGSYPLEEQKYTNYSYMKAPDKEFYA